MGPHWPTPGTFFNPFIRSFSLQITHQILNEINVMRHLYHRNIVLLFEVISDPTEDTIFMVMEVGGWVGTTSAFSLCVCRGGMWGGEREGM